jgi:NDP-sugar pyrophosphorylase family protein
MRAMILAAGLGTRLKPLTDNLPKALITVKNQTLLEILIKKLSSSGFDKIIINIHHFAELVLKHLNDNNYFGADISISDEHDELLDTGGGLKKASWFFDDGNPFLVHNVDVISNIDLKKIHLFHAGSDSIATLAVRNRKSSRHFLVSDDNLLCGWRNEKTGETKYAKKYGAELTPKAFSGIQVLSPDIFNHMPENRKFSLVDLFLKVSVSKKIYCYEHDIDDWIDVGKPENIPAAEKLLSEKK